MYRLNSTYSVVRTLDGAIIPSDDTNSDWQGYKVWLDQGNTPEPAPAALPVVPQIVTMRQARLVLLGAGLLGQVEASINALPEPQRSAARIEWDFSSEVHRDKPFVQLLAGALGLTPEQLDDLFNQANQL